jgi:hypothetical protein
MATASKQAVTSVEYKYTLTLTNAEAHELAFYLAQRGPAHNSATDMTDGIHDALMKAIYPARRI